MSDWVSFVEGCDRHAVLAIVTDALGSADVSLPGDARQLAQLRTIEQAARALRLTSLALDLVAVLRERGIRVVPFKGPVLAQQLYGSLAARRSLDLDLLVAPSDALAARHVLQREGLSFWLRLTSAQERRFLRYSNEFGLRAADGTIVELAWAFAPRYMAVELPMGEMLARARPTEIGGRELSCLAVEDLLVALAVHGGKHGWDRMVWVADIGWLVASWTDLDWAYVVRLARRARVLRMVQVALALAQDFLGVHVPSGAVDDGPADPRARQLAAGFMRRFALERPARGSHVAHGLHLGLKDGPRDRLQEIYRLAVTPTVEDWQFVPLPESMAWAYPAVRPFRLASKYLVRAGD